MRSPDARARVPPLGVPWRGYFARRARSDAGPVRTPRAGGGAGTSRVGPVRTPRAGGGAGTSRAGPVRTPGPFGRHAPGAARLLRAQSPFGRHASAASLEIFGGGWAGNVSPSRSSRIARSGFGSTSRGRVTSRPSVFGMTTSTIFTARNLSMIWRGGGRPA